MPETKARKNIKKKTKQKKNAGNIHIYNTYERTK